MSCSVLSEGGGGLLMFHNKTLSDAERDVSLCRFP